MKVVQTKTTKAASAQTPAPFFNKGGAQDFFHPPAAEQPFFCPGPMAAGVQAKLTIGKPNDPYEQEADAVADKVVQRMNEPEPVVQKKEMPAVDAVKPLVQAKCNECEQEEKLQTKEENKEEPDKILRKAIFESNEEKAPVPALMKKANSSAIQAKCNECEQEEKLQKKETVEPPPEKLQLKPLAETKEVKIQPKAEPVPVIQAKSIAPAPVTTPAVQAKCAACEQEEKQQEPEEETDNAGPGLQKKPVFESNADDAEEMVQRSCRECEEGDQVFLKAAGIQRAAATEAAADGSRESIVARAKGEVGKVEAKQNDGTGKRVGSDHLLEYFHIAAPDVWDDSIIETHGAQMPSWCGIFSVWAHKKAGKDIGTWQMGRGVSAFGTLTATDSPQPGDIGYIDQPYQHHCIVERVDGDTIHSIDGNSGLFSEVKENQRPRSEYSGFFTAFAGAAAPVQRKEENVSEVQAKEEGTASTASSPIENKLTSSRSGGNALPSETRSGMEQHFGADFSSVKVHTDSSAVQMSKDLSAQAFTHGNHIYFNEGKYDPGSSSGKHLLAHELTHTIQQGAAIAKKPDIQKQDTVPTPDADVNTVAQAVYDALDGWTSSADSANILTQLRNRNKPTLDLVITQVGLLGHIANKAVFEWMISDMVTSDWRALRDHCILVRVQGLEEIIANEIYNILSGYTSEDDSREILRLFSGTSPLMGEQMTQVLTQLETKADMTENNLAEWLFDDLTLLDADRLSTHFFGSASIKAVRYAAHWRANKIRDLIAGWTGEDDSNMIVTNFERTPDGMRNYVLYELNRICMQEWSEPASRSLMDNMWQSDYERLRVLVPELPVWDVQRNWLEWLWTGVTVLFDYVGALIEYAVCGVAGAVWGILLIVRDIVVVIWDILKGLYNFLGWILNKVSGNRLARAEAESFEGFFSAIGQFFGAPGEAISHMWNDLVLEASLIEGPFRECQQAFFWMTRIANFVVNIILIFAGGYGLAKMVAEGIEALVNLVRAGELLAALGRLPARMYTAIKGLPAAIARGVVTGIGTVVRLIRNPITIVESVRNTISIIRLAAADEGYFTFLRQQAGRALGNEAEFWRARREFWTGGAETTTADLTNVEGQLVQAVDASVDDPARAEALINEAEQNATAARSQADDLMNDVRGTGAQATETFDNRLPERWRQGMPERPGYLDYSVNRLRAANVSEDTIVAIIRNAALNTDQRAADFFAQLNRFAIRGPGHLGQAGFEAIVNGLAGDTNFIISRFLMQRVSAGQDVAEIVRALSLEDIGSLRVRFPAGPDADFTNNLRGIVSRINGSRDDIFALLNEAGEGQQAMDNLTGALDRLGEARYTPEQIRESLAFGRRLTEAIAQGGDEAARTIWGEKFAGRDPETGRIRVAEGLTADRSGDQASAYIRARLQQIANAVLGGEGGTEIDSVTWGVIRDSILNTDLPTIVKYDILGEVWAFSKVRQYRNLGFAVIREVHIRVLNPDGTESTTFAKLDAVLRRANEILYKEFKSTAAAATSGPQDQVYQLLNDGATDRLRPFGTRAEEAFGGPTLPDFRARPVDIERPPL